MASPPKSIQPQPDLPGSISPGRTYCSEYNGAESMAGTADNVDVWLLLEYKPAWRSKAMADNQLAAPIREWIESGMSSLVAAGLKVRPQFIRQPEYDDGSIRLMLGIHGRLMKIAVPGYDAFMSLDLSKLLNGDDQGIQPEWLSEPQYLVCTNGQRDLCCAKFGLPTYAALRERVGQRAWQVTHLGGHRFAPNVLVVPGAVLYGRVVAEEVTSFVEAIEQGAVDFERLRGRTGYPAMVQAAEAALARQNLKLLHVDGDESGARVSFAGSDEVRRVEIRRSETPIEVQKSCGTDELDTVHPFIVN